MKKAQRILDFLHNKENKLLYQISKDHIFKYKKTLLILFVLIILGVGLGNLSPYLYGRMVDCINAKQLDGVWQLILIYSTCTIVASILSLLESYIGEIISFKTTNSIRHRLLNNMMMTRQYVLDEYTSGELMSRLNGDSGTVTGFVLDFLTQLGQIIINLTISIIYILAISVRLSTVAIFYLPATFCVNYCARKYFRKIALKNKKLADEQYTFISEIMKNIQSIKIFQLERNTSAKFKEIIQQDLKIKNKMICLSSIVNFINNLIVLLSSMYIIYISAVLIKDNVITIGIMVSFNTYINLLFSTVSKIWQINISKQSVMVSAERLSSFLYEFQSESILDGPKNMEQSCEKKQALSICFHDVSFQYASAEFVALDHLNLEITKNGLFAIVGENGCGKSTVAKLLVGLYKPNNGEIFIGEQDIQEMKLSDLRRCITYIQSTGVVFKDTLYNNIAFANKDANQQDVYYACRMAGVDEFANTLPQKYETIIGEDGSTLSSGQKQKIGVARALLRNSPIIILDETTANLDGKAESDMLKHLESLSKDKIVLLISHKLSTVIRCDIIFVMDAGRVTARGTHEKLIAQNEIYQKLFGK